jgi:hypothetical protein
MRGPRRRSRIRPFRIWVRQLPTKISAWAAFAGPATASYRHVVIVTPPTTGRLVHVRPAPVVMVPPPTAGRVRNCCTSSLLPISRHKVIEPPPTRRTALAARLRISRTSWQQHSNKHQHSRHSSHQCHLHHHSPLILNRSAIMAYGAVCNAFELSCRRDKLTLKRHAEAMAAALELSMRIDNSETARRLAKQSDHLPLRHT